MSTIDQITSQILQLSFADRHALVEQLNTFVDEESKLSDQLAEEADIALMEQRLDDFLAGKIKSVPWDKALQELRGTLKNESRDFRLGVNGRHPGGTKIRSTSTWSWRCNL